MFEDKKRIIDASVQVSFWKSANTSNTQWKCDKYAKSKQIQNMLIKITANIRLKTCKEVDSGCSAWVRKRSVANLLRYIIETLCFIGIFCCQIICCNFVKISPRLRYLDIKILSLLTFHINKRQWWQWWFPW